METYTKSGPTPQGVIDRIQAAQGGDSAAMGSLCAAEYEWAMAVARKACGNYHDAEEVVQDAFLRAVKSIRLLRAPYNLRGWLWVILMRTVANRRARHPPPLLYDPESLEPTLGREATPVEIVLEREKREWFNQMLGQLPRGDKDRAVITSAYLHGNRRRQVARALGTTEKAIKSRLQIIRSCIKKRVEADRVGCYLYDLKGGTFHGNGNDA